MKNVLLAVLVACVATPAIADSIAVPNGDFETLYKPGTAIEGQVSDGGWTLGVGADCGIDSGEYTFDDSTTGDIADIPGWIGADRDGWIDAGGTYGRDQTTGNYQGSVSSQHNSTDGGRQAYLSNGGAWGNPAGGLIVSDAPLATIESGTSYTVSMMVHGTAETASLDLLADGIALAPTASVVPTPANEWQEFSRTYDASELTAFVGQPLTIQLGLARGATGAQTRFDDVTLTTQVVPEPSTLVLMLVGLVGLALYRRRK